jgi:hypothetical protein
MIYLYNRFLSQLRSLDALFSFTPHPDKNIEDVINTGNSEDAEVLITVQLFLLLQPQTPSLEGDACRGMDTEQLRRTCYKTFVSQGKPADVHKCITALVLEKMTRK